ncbi:MAG: oligosaccharide flippase family protein [Brevinematales bacterium]|nr:oligosaccharide flippase family protein [Brevinematales bacterium]
MISLINKTINKIKSDRFYFDSAVLTFFTVLGNLVAFLVNIIYTRTLPPGQYGAVMSINSFINILSTIAIAFRMFNVRETSELISKGQVKKAVNISYKFALYSFILLSLLFLSAYPFYQYITAFMNIDFLPFIMATMVIILSYLNSITSSLFQSLKIFLLLGIVSFLYPFTRFILTYPYILVWNGYTGATASMLVGSVLSFIASSLILILNKEYREISTDNGQFRIKLSYFIPLIPIVLINMFYSILNFGDVIFSRRYFNEADTDIFAIASTIAKANLFVIIPISYVVLPRMIEDLNTKGYKASIMALFKGIILSLLASILYLIFIALFGDIILKIFGERYLEAKSILTLFTLAVIPLGISFLLINYSIVFKNWYFLIPLAITDFILITGFIMFHNTFIEIIIVDLVAGTFLMVSLSIMLLLSKEPKTSASKEEAILEENTQI